MEERHDELPMLAVELVRQSVTPGLQHGLPAQGAGFQVDHTTSANCGRLDRYDHYKLT